MLLAARLFYVQDERYGMGAWMRRSGDVSINYSRFGTADL